jgi:large subunit ribosomal protein L24
MIGESKMQTLKPTTKPTKQRKMLRQAPDHIRYKFFAAHLSPKLATSHGAKNLPVRNGDTVRIMRGDHKGVEGKITRIDRKKYRIYVEGLTREKVDGTTIPVPVHPSKVIITNLNLDDKWRKKILERKKGARRKVREITKKPPKEIVETKEEVIEEKVKTEEKSPEKKPRVRKKREIKKPTARKVEKEEAKPEEKRKTKKTGTKQKTNKKTEGGT